MDSGGNAGSSSDVPKTSSQAAESVASHPGCGCSSSPSTITVRVTPTTGGQFDLQVAKTESVENLKKLISKKLKVPKERICLLHRDRQLRDGTLQENQLMDGSRLTLLPSVETGLLAQRPEQSVMQALESLNDSQVNDFLSGKAPLNLTMRLGDHMMLIQLQLSTVTPSVARRSAGTNTTASTSHQRPRTATASTSTSTSSSSSSTSSTSSTTSTTSSSTSSTTTTSSSSSTSSSSAPASVFPPPARPCKFFLGKPPPAPPPAAPAAAPSPLKSLENTVAATTSPSSSSSPSCKCEQPQQQTAAKPTLDTRALAEASRNLTQTLKQLSSEVLTSRSDPVEDTARARRQGAIIESMHHHGRGVYSGTFSGTLNPALQDRFGRPKRDISTIIHILNDLLCATPQYRRHARQGHTITVEASAPKPAATPAATPATDKTHPAEDSTEDAESLSPENQATRGKMEHLRLIMEERRARRRARREARSAPYTTQWSAKSESLSQAGVAGEPMETDQGAGAAAPSSASSEPQLCEMNPPEPVVA